MMPTIRDLHSAIEAWAPAATAQSYDNVGLQIGRMSKAISNVLVALDVTPAVVEEAIASNADCVLTHHPLLFKPLKQLTDKRFESNVALMLAEAGIALYCAHTNLDAARDGVSFRLAEQLGLKDISFLGGLDDVLVKLVVFVPTDNLSAVRKAAFATGAGRIGLYDDCSFSTGGTGTFRPLPGTNPAIGSSGGAQEQVSEARLEMQVPRWKLDEVLAAVSGAHPYEEVAYDVIPVEQSFLDAGIGAVGHLASPETLSNFLDRTGAALQNSALRFVGDPDSMVSKVAVCGGSGADFTRLAMRSGADVYVTSDVTYHRYFEVLSAHGEPRMALVNAGHYETEQSTEDLLCERLSAALPGVQFSRTTLRTAPVRTWVCTNSSQQDQ